MTNFKQAYPVIFTITKDSVLAEIPDLEVQTEGEDLVDSIQRARELILVTGMAYFRNNLKMPEPSISEYMANAALICGEKSVLSFVDIDLDQYIQDVMVQEYETLDD